MKNNIDKPLVSIQCLVYNHEPFLRRCLDGIVMQKTDFPFEAIVHDDVSTDGSVNIIREYAEKYPDIIKPIYEKENQFSKNDDSLAKVLNNASSGKYIANCEGDDYWTDPLKLQKQVDFLEAHPEVSICTHMFTLYNVASNSYTPFLSDYTFIKDNGKEVYYFDLDNYWHRWAVQPITCVYRNLSCVSKMPREKYKIFYDATFYYYYLKLSGGKGAMLKDNMAVYRVDNGVWASRDQEDQCKLRFYQAYSIYQNEGDKRCLYDCRITITKYIKVCIKHKHWREAAKQFLSIKKLLGIKAVWFVSGKLISTSGIVKTTNKITRKLLGLPQKPNLFT